MIQRRIYTVYSQIKDISAKITSKCLAKPEIERGRQRERPTYTACAWEK